MQKLLFVCNQNVNRSVTAEELFKDRFNTKSAGLYNDKPVTKKQLEWADVIIVMEEAQRGEIARRFPEMYLKKQILCLDILDIYQHNQPELKQLLSAKLKESLC